jgi:lysophospholipase L1-like esterase
MLRARFTAQATQIEMTNSGRPGEWAEDGALRLPGVMSSNRPDVVLLMEGLNDLTALGDRGVMRAWNAIDTMAKEVRGRGARLFLATLPPSRTGVPNAVPPALVQTLNSRIRTTAAGEGAVLVDVHQALSANLPAYIGPDGIHPTAAGYERIAEVFFAAIRAELEARIQ